MSVNGGKSMNNPSVESIQAAAQCWCDEETKSKLMDSDLALAFAKRLDKKDELIAELQDFAMWMTGCGYEFTQHEFFNIQRDKLLKSDKVT